MLVLSQKDIWHQKDLESMELAQKPNEKLAAVREAYLLDIIPNIRRIYEKTNRVRESFVLVHCAILSLSGFYAGTKGTSGTTYRQYVADFFPNGYAPDRLWKDLRNGLVHGYTVTSTYVLAHKHPEMHLYLRRGVKSERTGIPADLTFLNFENFLDDFERAASLYFEKVQAEPELLSKLCKRYDVAPPASYVSDEQRLQLMWKNNR